MFTLESIATAHEQVLTGVDFPMYIQALALLGVKKFTTYVVDGHTIYCGIDHQLESNALHTKKTIASYVDVDTFKRELTSHQLGNTDYSTFVQMCADTGIAYWIMDIDKSQCTYFALSGEDVYVEKIG